MDRGGIMEAVFFFNGRHIFRGIKLAAKKGGIVANFQAAKFFWRHSGTYPSNVSYFHVITKHFDTNTSCSEVQKGIRIFKDLSQQRIHHGKFSILVDLLLIYYLLTNILLLPEHCHLSVVFLLQLPDASFYTCSHCCTQSCYLITIFKLSQFFSKYNSSELFFYKKC